MAFDREARPYFLKNQLRGQLFDTAPELCRLSPDFLS